MNFKQRQGLILGFIVGLAVGAFFYYESGNPWCFALAPVAALMGMAPQFLKPADLEEDD